MVDEACKTCGLSALCLSVANLKRGQVPGVFCYFDRADVPLCCPYLQSVAFLEGALDGFKAKPDEADHYINQLYEGPVEGGR